MSKRKGCIMANKIKKEELELMSYNDIAHIILKDKPKQTTLNIFKKIVKMLSLSESVLENKIGEFYTALTNDKRFILLDDGKWDLKENHKTVSLTTDDDLEDFDEDGNDYNLSIVKEGLQYQLYYHDSWGQAEDIETDYYDDMVDACYEMIMKLKEKNLL